MKRIKDHFFIPWCRKADTTFDTQLLELPSLRRTLLQFHHVGSAMQQKKKNFKTPQKYHQVQLIQTKCKIQDHKLKRDQVYSDLAGRLTHLNLSQNLNTLPDCRSQVLKDIRVLSSQILQLILHTHTHTQNNQIKMQRQFSNPKSVALNHFNPIKTAQTDRVTIKSRCRDNPLS